MPGATTCARLSHEPVERYVCSSSYHASHDVLITVEENALAGGAGSAVSEYFSECGMNCEVRHIAIDDRFIDHAGQGETRTDAGLTAEDILNKASPASASLHAQTAAVAL